MTKSQAIRLAKKLRAEGRNVKVFCESGIYTQPGRGLSTFSHYFVRDMDTFNKI